EEPAPGGDAAPSSTAPAAANENGAREGEAPVDSGTTAAVFVHIGGAVTSPGVVELPGGSRVVDAVRAAGGLLPDADPDRVNLAAVLVDGQRIVIPRVGQPVPAEVLATGPQGPTGASGGTADGSGGGA